MKIVGKITEAINNHQGQPILYASTTKGTMKLVVDGHHFRYSFRKGKYTIFQCCYKENKEECLVRVVTDQKLVYPLDGEHIHFVQATDKSVTSVKFTPGEEPEPEFVTITDVQHIEAPVQSEQEHVTLNIGDLIPQPIQSNVKLENAPSQETLEFSSELSSEKSPEVTKSKEVTPAEDPNEFREKIKKRLQKALLGKKK
ncbi:modifier of mdg4 [Lucilia sericata]|uniref:modifier of mdg4 n=1 Tax=Lucilia sericata TaxID=13632 RepID=UPI0018A85AF0|nr:modifier of mdg4 [Lucilia sericata]